MFLSGTNTYGGLTQITAGFLNASNSSALGLNGAGAAAQGTVVLAGGTLGLGSTFGSGIAIGNEALTINGAGTTNFGGAIGALANVFGANTYAGAVTLGSNSSISVDLGTTLTLTGGIIKNGLNLLDRV